MQGWGQHGVWHITEAQQMLFAFFTFTFLLPLCPVFAIYLQKNWDCLT